MRANSSLRSLGTMLYSAGDTTQAAVHQRKAVIVFERVCGLDHHDTINAYHQLSTFVNVSSQLVLGLRFLHRAMMLSSLVSVRLPCSIHSSTVLL